MTSSFDNTLASLGINRSGTAGKSAPASSGSQSLGQADFLKLMTAQMQNQDPFNPVDNTQMVAQMAQFSSLSGITEMSSTLKSIAARLSGTSSADAMAYVGKTVLTRGDTAYARTTGGIAGAIELGDDATELTLTIQDAKGATLKTINLGRTSQGMAEFDWDGKNDAGEAAGNGPFKIIASAKKDGKAIAAQPMVWAPVLSVTDLSGGNPRLIVAGLGTIDIADVRQVG